MHEHVDFIGLGCGGHRWGNPQSFLRTWRKENRRMRKTAAIVVITIVVSLGTAVMAQENMKVTGLVMKIDMEALSVTILPQKGPEVTVIMKDPESLSKIKIAEIAEARYTVKDGKNMGRRLRLISEGCSP
jgi:hypothetical protein